jgi:hypothetical protein
MVDDALPRATGLRASIKAGGGILHMKREDDTMVVMI